MPAKSLHPPYSPHPSIAYSLSVLAAMAKKTGRNYEEWIAFTKEHGPPGEIERRAWLKDKHGLGATTAWWIAEMSVGKGMDTIDPRAYLKLAPGYVDAMYEGKENLRPLHDQIIALARTIGKDVRICPCQTIVPLYRNHVFAEIKPATRSRIDLGLALGDMKPGGRLVDTGGFKKKNRITHRIPIASPGDIDADVRKWLKAAYDRDG